MKKKVTEPIKWLILLNVIAVVIFGGKALYLAAKDRQRRNAEAATAARIISNVGAMSLTDGTRLMVLSNDLEHGATISDADLDWCLDRLKGGPASSQQTTSRRLLVDQTLGEAVPGMDASQKQRLYQAMIAEIASDSRSNEIGVDVLGPARIFGEIGNLQAIAILRPYLNDPRPMVHRSVVSALAQLEKR